MRQRGNDPSRRRYDASGRRAAAAQRRLDIVTAARSAFEERGWTGTRIHEIAKAAGVSPKTVEAFGTKAALLHAAVDYAIRGDVDAVPMPQREAISQMDHARDATTMLRLHALHLRTVNARSARIATVVEQAAAADPSVAALWRRINHNRSYAVAWATTTLLAKRGRRRGLTAEAVHPVFWVALDWNTYRTLTELAGLDDDGYQAWLDRYYQGTLLP